MIFASKGDPARQNFQAIILSTMMIVMGLGFMKLGTIFWSYSHTVGLVIGSTWGDVKIYWRDGERG